MSIVTALPPVPEAGDCVMPEWASAASTSTGLCYMVGQAHYTSAFDADSILKTKPASIQFDIDDTRTVVADTADDRYLDNTRTLVKDNEDCCLDNSDIDPYSRSAFLL